MGDGNLLSLRWNNHISNFKFTLGQLQQKDLFSDATIACDRQFYPVHKFVLSTCSDYFANMFERTPCKHPIIVLKDISSKDIELLLSYMYGGEVRVSQIDLPSLIKAAETLQIKGLFAPDDPPGSPTGSKSYIIDSEEEKNESQTKKQKLDFEIGSKNGDVVDTVKKEIEEDLILNNEEIKDNDTSEENAPAQSSLINEEVDSNLVENLFYEENTNFSKIGLKRRIDDITPADSSSSRDSSNLEASDIPLPQSDMVVSQDSDCVPWSSSLVSCSTTTNPNNINSSITSSQQNPLYSHQPMVSGGKNKVKELKSNVEENEPNNSDAISFVEPSISLSERMFLQSQNSFKCPLCEYTTHNRSWLFIHIRKHTGEKPFSCPFCSFRSAQRGNLNVHVKKLHASLAMSSQ